MGWECAQTGHELGRGTGRHGGPDHEAESNQGEQDAERKQTTGCKEGEKPHETKTGGAEGGDEYDGGVCCGDGEGKGREHRTRQTLQGNGNETRRTETPGGTEGPGGGSVGKKGDR
eukprot:661252-Rhodomonas_salina.1